MRLVLATCILLLCSSLGRASVYVKPVGMYESTSSNGVSNSSTRLEVGAGYITEKGWVLGGIYVNDTHIVSSGAFGPSAGWTTLNDSGPFIIGHYFLPSNSASGSASGGKRSGFQVDFGIKAPLRRASLVVQLSYTKYLANAVSSNSGSSYIRPAFGLFINF